MATSDVRAIALRGRRRTRLRRWRMRLGSNWLLPSSSSSISWKDGRACGPAFSFFVMGFGEDEGRLLAIALIASQVTPTPVGRGFSMLIKTEYDIQFHLPIPTPMVAMLHLHPSLEPAVREGNELKIEHIDRETKRDIAASEYRDTFGNRCTRFMTPAGAIRLSGTSVVEIKVLPDPINAYARQVSVEDLPSEVLQFLL